MGAYGAERLRRADRTALQLDVPGAAPAHEAVATLGLSGVVLLDPPHVSLAWPWLSGPAAALALPGLAAAVAEWPAVELELERVGAFEARGAAAVVHLLPADPQPVLALAAALPGAMVDRPHLSVARVATADVDAMRGALTALLPLRACAAAVEVRARVDGRWQVVQRLAFGSTGPR